jgi:hypothetical protein
MHASGRFAFREAEVNGTIYGLEISREIESDEFLIDLFPLDRHGSVCWSVVSEFSWLSGQ